MKFFDFRSDDGAPIMFMRRGNKHLYRPDLNGQKSFEQTVLIFFDDLKPEAQQRLLDTFKTTVDQENWGMMPVITLKRRFTVK